MATSTPHYGNTNSDPSRWQQVSADRIVFTSDQAKGYTYAIQALRIGSDETSYTVSEDDTQEHTQWWIAEDGSVAPSRTSPPTLFHDFDLAVRAVTHRRNTRPPRRAEASRNARTQALMVSSLERLVAKRGPDLGEGDHRLQIDPALVRGLRQRIERCGCGLRHHAEIEYLQLVERASGGGELAVDADAMWRMLTRDLYGSSDLLALATREALQNSVDAIRAAYDTRGQHHIDEGTGVFRVSHYPSGYGYDDVYQQNVRYGTLVFTDNGIGMSLNTVRTKFLTLGATGKGGKLNVKEYIRATGGFGAAKAVILGASNTSDWTILTRDHKIKSRSGTSKYDFSEIPPVQGTGLVLANVTWSALWSPLLGGGSYTDAEDRIRIILAASYLPDIQIEEKDGEEPAKVITPLFVPDRGEFLPRFSSKNAGGEVDWGVGNTAYVRAYRRSVDDKSSGRFYVRLNGIFQFAVSPDYQRTPEGSSVKVAMRSDIVVDFSTEHKPGDRRYPFPASRVQFNEDSDPGRAFYQMRKEFEQEELSSDENREFDTLNADSVHESEREGAAAVMEAAAEIANDPDFRALLADLLGGVDDYLREERKAPIAPRDAAGPEAPGAPGLPPSEPHFIQQARDWVTGMPTAEDVFRGEGRIALGKLIQDVLNSLSGGKELKISDAAQNAITRLQAGEEIEASDADAILAVISEAPLNTEVAGEIGNTAVELTLGAITTLVGAAVGGNPDVTDAEKRQVDEKIRKGPANPFGKAAVVKISRRNYDPERAKQFLANAKEYMPHLIMWDMTLRLVAKEAGITNPFRSGFVLDSTVRGMSTGEGKSGSRNFAYTVLINPDGLDSVIRAHRDRPQAIASFLHHIAAHELTHLPFMGQGHTEKYVAERETVGITSAHLIPAIEQVVVRTLNLKPSIPRWLAGRVGADPEAAARIEARVAEAEGRATSAEADRDRYRAMVEGDHGTLGAVLEQLRDLIRTHHFRQWLSTPTGASFLPEGVTSEILFAALDASPTEAVAAIRSALRSARTA